MSDQVEADPLLAEAVNALEQLADIARASLTADLASGAAVGTPFAEDTLAGLSALRAGLVRAGLGQVCADRVVTAWMFFPERSVSAAVTAAEAAPRRKPGGLGGAR